MNSHPSSEGEKADSSMPSASQPPLGQSRILPQVVTSAQLFRGRNEIGIEHEGALYRLRITRQGKLILTK